MVEDTAASRSYRCGAAPGSDTCGLAIAIHGGGSIILVDAVAGDREHGVCLQPLHATLAAGLKRLRHSSTSHQCPVKVSCTHACVNRCRSNKE